MTFSEISNIRIVNQKIAETKFQTAKEIVKWMGAMQAQDYSMAKWAIGIRVLKPTDKKIETSLNKGEILRAHLMRPTWHFVSGSDIYWMLELTAPQIRSAIKSRHKSLEITGAIIAKTRSLIERTLLNRNNVTREELGNEFERAKIKTTDNRLSHLMLCAELDGVVCSGQIKNGKQTYALLSERVPQKKVLTRDESLAELATLYFTSHGPATRKDFAWWSGLSAGDSNKAMEFVKSNFIWETTGAEKYWMTNSFSGSEVDKPSLYLLPAYDEFLISYRDRSASVLLMNYQKTVSSNGIFYPVILVNGQVRGLWKRNLIKGKMTIIPDFFERPDKHTRSLFEEKVYGFAKFLNKEIDIRY